MYKVYLDGEILYHPNMTEEFPIADAKLALEVNKAGTFVFTIYKKNPRYDSIQKIKSIIEVYENSYRLFRGRVLNVKRGMYNELQVTCEGELAFFVDSRVRPYTFSGTVEEYFAFLIESHNAYVSEEKRFKTGRVTVTSTGDSITRENQNYPHTLDEIQDGLIEKLGGYLWIREEADGVYIDYLKDFELTNTQEIKFGENLVDLEEVIKGQDIATVIIPLGGKLTDEGGNETDKRLTIAEVNEGQDYVFEQSAVDRFGWIEKVVELDDITVASELLKKGMDELQNYVNLTRSIELTAIDLHNVDGGIQAFRHGRYTKIISNAHDLDELLLTRKIEINLLDPTDGLLQLGDERKTFVDKQTKADKDIQGVKESIDKSYQINQEMMSEKVNNAVNEIYASISEQNTTILQDSEAIIMEALKSYATTGSLESFEETVTAQLKFLADEMTLKFTETTDQIVNVNKDLQDKFNTITKYFVFDINGLQIGCKGEAGESPFKVVIDHDRYSMLVNGVEVLYLDPDGGSNIPELYVSKMLRLFNSYKIEMDAANGIVNCMYIGGE